MRRLILSSLLLIGLFSTTLYAQCPTSNRPGVHVVKSNQTLYSISRQYNVSVDQLLYWNNMNMNDVLSVCRELKVAQQSFSTAPATSRPATSNVNPTPTSFNTNPATTVRSSNNFAPTTIDFSRRQRGKQHVVQPGETMAYIAALYGYTEYRFREINPIPAGQEVTPGSILLSTDCDCPRTSFNNDLNAFTSSPATSTTTTSRPTSTTSTSPTGNMTTGTFTGAGTSSPTTTNNTTATGTSTNPPSAGSNLPAAPASTNSTAATFMSAIERAMLEEVNLMRSNPKAYIPYVEEYAKQKRASMWGLKEDYYNSLIQTLNNTGPLPLLTAQPCLYTAAKRHGDDMVSARFYGSHIGSDNSSHADRIDQACGPLRAGAENIGVEEPTARGGVIQLLLDEGVPSLGHRKNLLNSSYNAFGCYRVPKIDASGWGEVKDVWVQVFGQQ